MSDFLGLPIRDGDEILGALFLANKRCPQAARAAAASPPRTRSCSDPRPARGDRPHQRPAVRAQPRAHHRRGALPARPRAARRGQPEALLAAADRPGRRRPGRPRPGPRQGRAPAGRRAGRRGRRRAARRRRRAAPRRPRRGRPRRDPAHPDPGPGPRPRRPGHLREPRRAGPARRPGGGACSGSPRRPCTTRCGTRAPTGRRHPGPARHRARVLRVTDDGSGFDPRAIRSAGPPPRAWSRCGTGRAGSAAALTVESAPGKGTTIEMEVPGG